MAKSYNSKLVELAETFRELEAELEQNQLPTNRNSREYIRWIQTSLNQILGIGLVVDGIMGPQTRNAIRRFQQQQGLVPDGIVGMKTEAALRTALNASYPSLAQTMQRTIYGWGQYQRRVQELPPDQQMTLAEVGDAIIHSFQPGRQRVRTVQVYGHADWDTPRNPQREQQMSEERAREVTNWLKSYVRGSIPTPIAWDNNASHIEWDTKGFGATQVIASPTSEANRKQNRRVEILLNSPQPGANGITCRCSPRRNGCPGCECKMSPNPNCQKYTCPSKSTVKRLSFQEMWDLIIRHYYCELPDDCNCAPCCIDKKQLRDIFSPELLIAIFWEETGFRNVPQINEKSCGPAVGFGQVQDTHNGVSSIFQACKFCGISPIWTPQEILCDDAKSVKIAGMLLWQIFCSKERNRNRKSALLAYVGNNRQSIVNGWVECEKRLQEIRQGVRPNTLSEFRAALSQAAPSSSYQPQEDTCVFPGGQVPNLNRACPTNLSCEQECERQFEECFLNRNECLRRRRKCLQNCQGIMV